MTQHSPGTDDTAGGGQTEQASFPSDVSAERSKAQPRDVRLGACSVEPRAHSALPEPLIQARGLSGHYKSCH